MLFPHYYENGGSLTLTVDQTPQSPDTKPGSQIHVTIKQPQQPFTISSGMIVDVEEYKLLGMPSKTALLKLFDRRHADQLREEYECGTWVPDVEEQYVDYTRKGEQESCLEMIRNDPGLDETDATGWSRPMDETWLAHKLLRLFKTEATTYNVLREHQGRDIPKLFATVSRHYATQPSALARCRRGPPIQYQGCPDRVPGRLRPLGHAQIRTPGPVSGCDSALH